ncbi:hypothetical protein QYF36_005070 [Acer negundo]|nr:hypothetical protein QYF36_005070 [Acer negundo]
MDNKLSGGVPKELGKAKAGKDTGSERQAMFMHSLTRSSNPESLINRTIATLVRHHKETMEGTSRDRKSPA